MNFGQMIKRKQNQNLNKTGFKICLNKKTLQKFTRLNIH